MASVTGVAGDGRGPRARMRAVFRLRVVSVTLLMAAAGCAVVKPHERENLARRSMIQDREPGERRFSQHQACSREGADGGTGEPGGGCGCN
jgi:hypothetical protein